jgi:hypothetical protein
MSTPNLKMTFADIVGTLCRYPQMYTMNGSFPEVIAYIECYTVADPKKSRRDWHGFSEWLSAEIGYPNHVVASVYLRQTYRDDAEALKELARLYCEYSEARAEIG